MEENSDSQLIFLKDKRMFAYEKDGEPTVLLQFACFNNKWVVMGDPSGKKRRFSEAIEALSKKQIDYAIFPVFYENKRRDCYDFA